MQYALLINERAEDFDLRTDLVSGPAYWAEWTAFSQAIAAAGIMTGGAGLQAPHTATTVRVGGGDDAVQDGPFADSKEMLGGFYLIDVPSLDEALQWAARVPLEPGRHVEVRPLIVMADRA